MPKCVVYGPNFLSVVSQEQQLEPKELDHNFLHGHVTVNQRNIYLAKLCLQVLLRLRLRHAQLP